MRSPLLPSLLFCLLMSANAAAQTGAISGTVTADGTASPLQDVSIQAMNPSGTVVGFTATNASGNYTIAGLPAGTYYLMSSNALGYVNEYFDDISCHGACFTSSAPAHGVPVVVASGATTGGRNFSLAIGGTISGKVTYQPTAAPLANIAVYVFAPSGTFFSADFTNGAGDYSLSGIAPGFYVVLTADGNGEYLNEMYDDVPCFADCTGQFQSPSVTLVPVTAGGVASNRNFALVKAGGITGTITSTATGLPVEGVTVYAYDAQGRAVVGETDASGVYLIGRLAAGTYTASTFLASSAGFLDEIYDNLPCRPIYCSPAATRSSGTPITVAVESPAAVANFALEPGASITGSVTNATTGAPLANVTVRIVAAGSTEWISRNTNASGVYTHGGLPPGTYYAFTRSGGGFIDEFYADVACYGDCEPTASSIGTPITVTTGGTVSGVNFGLIAGGRIGGTITDAATTAAIPSIPVWFYDAQNVRMGSAYTNSSGAYLSEIGLPSGIYFAVAEPGGYLGELFDNVPCAIGCNSGNIAATGTPISVTAGATTTGRNFSLERGGRIRGRVTQEGTGQPISGVLVRVHDGFGRLAAGTVSGADGVYETAASLLGGTYFVLARGTAGFAGEVYADKPCGDSCEARVASGAPVTIAPGGLTTGIDFTLAALTGAPGAPVEVNAATVTGGVLLSWTPGPGTSPNSYRLEAGFSPGATAVTIPVIGTSYLAAGVPPGRYYVRVRGVNGAGTGPASAELAFSVGPGGVVAPDPPQEAWATMYGRRLVLAWEDSPNGGAPADYLVEAGTATGLANIATIASGQRVFTYDPVPDGFYFLRVRARNAGGVSAPSNEVMIVVGGVAAPPGMPLRPGAGVAGSTVNLIWEAPLGPVTGYIIEAGSAPGFTNLGSLTAGPVTTLSVPGVPAGRYYVRVRAVNGQGRGVVSEEILLVVP